MVNKVSLPGWPSFTQEEAEAVSKVLISNRVNYWTGTEGREFEKEFARFADCDYAIAVANGTVALELALIAIGIQKGDEVIVTSRTFIASCSSIVAVGAIPVFADVCVNSQNITADTIRSVLSDKTKAIICVHLAGWPCDMREIIELAEQNDISVIEDCAQAHGAKYCGKSVGGIGDVGAWSFCQDKIMSTGGEGGMVTTNSKELWAKMWTYKDHGRNFEAVYNRKHPPGHRWYCDDFGTNWRLTEMQSTIGRLQLRKIKAWHKQRLANYKMLESACREFACLRTPILSESIEHAAYRFYTFIIPERLAKGWDQDRVVRELSEATGVCMHGSCSEVYMEKAFDNTDWRPRYRLPNAKLLGETSLAFLVHPTLTEEHVERICCSIRSVMREASLECY